MIPHQNKFCECVVGPFKVCRQSATYVCYTDVRQGDVARYYCDEHAKHKAWFEVIVRLRDAPPRIKATLQNCPREN